MGSNDGQSDVRTRSGKFRELVAWQKAFVFARRIYDLTQDFPDHERFGLTQQLRRAAVSVPSNIAEGWGRGTTVDYVRFLGMARGSLYEIQTQIWIARDLEYFHTDEQIDEDIAEIERIINGLIRSLRAKIDESR